MSLEIAADVWNEIQRQLASGAFASHDELLREALAALRLRDAELAAIGEGIADMEAGRTVSAREFDRQFRERNGIVAAE